MLHADENRNRPRLGADQKSVTTPNDDFNHMKMMLTVSLGTSSH